MDTKIIPSINCKDFECIKERLKITSDIFANLPSEALAKDGWVHIDISDGKFTPHVSLNNPEALSLWLQSKEVGLPKFGKSDFQNIEVHLMVENPEEQIVAWLRAGAKRIIVHLEAMRDSVYILEKCKKFGAQCFLAINQETEIERSLVHIDDFDGFLVLGVSPGPSGQEMKAEVIDKIRWLRSKKANAFIEIDGGVNEKTAKLAKDAGANIFIAGSFIFRNDHPKDAYLKLFNIVNNPE